MQKGGKCYLKKAEQGKQGQECWRSQGGVAILNRVTREGLSEKVLVEKAVKES